MSRPGGHRRRSAPASVSPEQPSYALPAPPTPPPPLMPPAPRPPATPPGAVSTLAPITAAPPVVPRPVPTLVPTGRGQRKAAVRDERRKTLRRVSIGGAIVVAIGALVAGVLVAGGGAAKKHVAALAPGTRTQHTVLLSLAPANGDATVSALLAHDSANGQGVVVFVPSNIVADVAGRGSMLFGNAVSFGPQVAGDTLSDLINVTVDGNWVLSPDALSALVDHLGGITADVPVDITVNGQVVVAQGDHQLINGAQAAAIAGYSAPDEPSVARLARFQNVLTGLMAKLGTDPNAVSATLSGLSAGSDVGAGKALVSGVVAGLDSDLKAQNVQFTTLATTVLDIGDSTERLAVDGTQVPAMVKQYLAGSVPQGVVAGRNRVIILNGTGQLGLGQSARDRLTAHGLVFVRSGNQPGFGFTHKPSVVLVPDATPASLASGNRVATALGLPTADVETSTVDTTAADVLVILGADYKP